jgi:hypothetical protein
VTAKHCRKAKKRKYNSRAAALYGVTSNAYRCPACRCWHLTRRDVPQPEHDPQIEQLVTAALGQGDT